MKFEIKGEHFVCDGQNVQIISASVHYFRNMPDTWEDTLSKLKALGCNCVETYCAWNMHEKHQGEYDFTGILDLAEFIRTAAKLDLWVILRPGPYICAEWEFGGLPWWLQADEDMEIRCMNKRYLECFERYLSRIFDEVRPLLSTNGGPIIMMQIENEYGYYGDDKKYLEHLYNYYRKCGIDVPLFTSDGTQRRNLEDGTVAGCLPALNFGSRIEENLKVHKEMFPGVPVICTEMWNGWFDNWGDEKHHTTSAEDYAAVVDEMLSIGGSLNMYMFIGGTNFGFSNGASHGEKYEPTVTSYDYDALLTECGDVTEKYKAVRSVIQKYISRELPEIPPDRPKKAYGKAILTESVGIFESLKKISKPVFSKIPYCMEKYGEGYGYIAYLTTLNRDYEDVELLFEDIGDRAHIYINADLAGIVYTNDDIKKINISAKKGDILTIFCENMGRTNFGPRIMRKKGIIGRCLLDNKIHFDWEVYPLPMDNLENLCYDDCISDNPGTFYRGFFEVDTPADTFLRTDNFTKGFAVINGFNLGRYWCIGPQKTLYVPKSLLKKGRNELVIFDSDGIKGRAEAEFTDKSDLGC